MEYKITMPQLTDTMETGKIVRWLKKEGDFVEENEPILEVETDKAVMEVPSFRSGVLKEILVEEGEEVPVGTQIAIVQTEIEKKEETTPKETKEEKEEITISIPQESQEEGQKLPEGTASPSAKRLARELGIDIKIYQEKGLLPIPAHEKDIKELFYKNFFDKDALELIKRYSLSLEEIVKHLKKEKITKKDVLEFIQENNIPQILPISDIQLKVIENLKKSTSIPVFHIYEQIKTGNLPKVEDITLTVWIIKILGDTMQNHYRTRVKLEENIYKIYPNSNICIAVAIEEELFMPVIKKVNKKTLREIALELKILKEKAQSKRLSLDDITGSTFSISNLGMFDILSFDAIIPPQRVGIVAIGTQKRGKTKVTFSFDHRVINGREAALFVDEFKKRFTDTDYLNNLKEEPLNKDLSQS
ncbi:MAG: 2-oxo acid dehydrogenase subunit E2 [Aquificae bacterium]|nr:2-oxo acid dehydrogenase subunit E2 [Aquificota bacterium]